MFTQFPQQIPSINILPINFLLLVCNQPSPCKDSLQFLYNIIPFPNPIQQPALNQFQMPDLPRELLQSIIVRFGRLEMLLQGGAKLLQLVIRDVVWDEFGGCDVEGDV